MDILLSKVIFGGWILLVISITNVDMILNEVFLLVEQKLHFDSLFNSYGSVLISLNSARKRISRFPKTLTYSFKNTL